MRCALQAWREGEMIYQEVVMDGRARKFQDLRQVVFPDGSTLRVDLAPLRPYERVPELTPVAIRDALNRAARTRQAIVWDRGPVEEERR